MERCSRNFEDMVVVGRERGKVSNKSHGQGVTGQ
jgi:hypothetical protein